MKVSDELARKIAQLISEGVPEGEAAEQAGVDRANFFKWMKLGRENKPEFMSFFRAIQNAKAKRTASKAVG